MSAQPLTGIRDNPVAWPAFLLSRTLRRVMLVLGVFAGSLSLVFGADGTSAMHAFTDHDGRVLNATITSVSGTDVYLQRVDGDPFMVKIDVFMEKDQSYIRQWAQQHPSAVHLQISAISGKSSDPQSPAAQSFKVSLKNAGNKIPDGLHMDYIVFQLPATGHSTGGLPTRFTGSVSINDPQAADHVTVETDPLSDSGTKLAIWVRIYTSTGEILQEWKSSTAIANQKWDVVPPKTSL